MTHKKFFPFGRFNGYPCEIVLGDNPSVYNAKDGVGLATFSEEVPEEGVTHAAFVPHWAPRPSTVYTYPNEIWRVIEVTEQHGLPVVTTWQGGRRWEDNPERYVVVVSGTIGALTLERLVKWAFGLNRTVYFYLYEKFNLERNTTLWGRQDIRIVRHDARYPSLSFWSELLELVA